MPKKITKASIEHMALVFADTHSPRNEYCDGVLAVKAEKKPNFLSQVVERLKKGWLVDDGVPDNIDNDGDGADDYEAIVGLLTSAYYDLQSAMGIGDSEARSVAVCTAIDNLLEKLDDMRSGEEAEGKAGARHSAADKAHIDALGTHLEAAKAALAAASDAHAALSPADAEDAKDGGKDEADEKAAPVEAIPEPQDAPAEKAAPEGVFDPLAPLGTPESFVPPIDDAPAPAEGDLAEKAGEIDMTQEQIDALVAKAVENASKSAAEAAVKATVDALQPQIDAAKAEAAGAVAAAAALGATARKAGAPSTMDDAPAGPSRLQRAVKAALSDNPDSPVI